MGVLVVCGCACVGVGVCAWCECAWVGAHGVHRFVCGMKMCSGCVCVSMCND